MTVFTTIQGTSNTSFRVGLTGPTFYTGSADPTVTPPTPLADGFRDGDIYFRSTTGGSAIWVIDNGGTWTQIASGAGGGSFSGDILMNPGAQFLGDDAADATAPAYAFDGDDDTGMFQGAADEIGFSVGGTQAFVIESDGTLASTTAGYETLVLADNDIPNRKYVEDTFINAAGDTFTGDLNMGAGTQLFLDTGSAADPALSFLADPDNGLFLDGGFGVDATTFSAGGTGIMTMVPAGTVMRSGTQFAIDPGLVGVPGFTVNGDSTTGFYQPVGGTLAFTSLGTEVIRFSGSTANGSLLWQGGDGAVGGPAMSFSSDTASGMYLAGAGDVGISAGGTDALRLDSDSVLVGSGRLLQIQDGTIGAPGPGMQFASDSTTGLYSPGVGSMGIVASGVEVARAEIQGLRVIDGTSSDPSLAFLSETNTGVYRPGAGIYGVTVLGTPQMILSTTEARFDQQIRVDEANQNAAGPAFSFTVDTNSGIYSGGADEVGISTGGIGRWEVNSTGDFVPQAATYDIGTSGVRVQTVYATTFDGTATAAQYSDLAERYTVGDCCELEPGDVVVICEHEDHDICLCGETTGDTAVLGVVSTAPAFMMNKDAGTDEEAPYIALRGRVPVKVCGDVKKGDLLITCGECDCHEPCAGYARALQDWEKSVVEYTHSVFAKALSSHDSQHGNGVVEAVIL